jgi:fatty acid desaturase
VTTTLSNSLIGQRGSEYAALSRRVRAAGLMAPARRHYAWRIALTLAFFAACWVGFVFIGASWLTLLPAVLLGLASTQVAFLGHDGGHQQISSSRIGNTIIGMINGNLLTGLSTSWWADKHNRHHANPNREDHDPDIGEGVLAFTTGQAANRSGRLARTITAYQAVLFFPLLTLEALNLHVASVRRLLSTRTTLRKTELFLLLVHVAVYVGAVLWVLTPLQALAFVGIHQAVFGFYMGCSFAPNHKGMPIIGAHEKLDFLRRQVLTSRNVRGGWFVDELLGGLNYQVEHHLFPSMPRPHLRRAQRLVRDYCAERRITYTETGLFGSYAVALRYLHSLGEPLRAR